MDYQATYNENMIITMDNDASVTHGGRVEHQIAIVKKLPRKQTRNKYRNNDEAEDGEDVDNAAADDDGDNDDDDFDR